MLWGVLHVVTLHSRLKLHWQGTIMNLNPKFQTKNMIIFPDLGTEQNLHIVEIFPDIPHISGKVADYRYVD